MAIIVTNRKCPIVQQSRVDRWKTVHSNKSEDNENEHDKNNGKIASLSLTEKKKDLNFQDRATIDVMHINVRKIRFLLTIHEQLTVLC